MFSLLFALTLQAFAAPFPGTGNPTLAPEKPGLFFSSRGFKLDAANTAWVQSTPPKQIPSLVAVYNSPVAINGQQPALTVRVDDLRHKQGLKNYIKRWMQDYTRFGFDVLTAKSIKINQNSAFLLDIISRETKKQLRQVVFIKEKTAVILTCRDHQDSFNKTVQDCNQIIKTFNWVKTESATN